MSAQRTEWPHSNLYSVDQKPHRHSHRHHHHHSAQEQELPVPFISSGQSPEDVNNLMHYLQQHHKQSNNQKECKEHIQQSQQIFESSKNYFLSCLPFAILIILKIGIEHQSGILLLLFSQATFAHCNSMARNILSSKKLKEKKRRMTDAAFASSILLLNILLIFVVFSRQRLYRSFYLMPISMEMSDIGSLLWVLLLNDFTLKFATILLKLFICFLVPKCLLFTKKKGQWYQLIENLSQSYRGVVPIVPWVYFLLVDGAEQTSSWLSIILFVVYVIFKSLDLYAKLKKVKKIVYLFIFSRAPWVNGTSSALNTSMCPICHYPFQAPVTTECGHTFCEECLSEWMDREQACPLCAQKLHDNPVWRDGATSIMPQLF